MSQENKNHILHMGEKGQNLKEPLVEVKNERESNDETKSATSHKDDDDFV